MATMSDRPQPPHVLAQRVVVNRNWPRNPRSFRDHRPGFPVMARLVFEGEGEAWLAGHAVRWDATHVYVEIDDARLGSNGVWLKPADVYRAAPDEPDDDPSGDSMA